MELRRVCVCVCVCDCASGAISKEVLLQLTQALANRREHQNALYLRLHTHAQSNRRGTNTAGGWRETH